MRLADARPCWTPGRHRGPQLSAQGPARPGHRAGPVRRHLAWKVAARPPCAVADILALPLADSSVDDVAAAFVLNHLTNPVLGLAELARVTRCGSAVLAAAFSNDSRSEARDRVDAAAQAAG